MDEKFDAETFVTRLNLGQFDRNLFEEVRKLSTSDLEEVAKILLSRRTEETSGKKVQIKAYE